MIGIERNRLKEVNDMNWCILGTLQTLYSSNKDPYAQVIPTLSTPQPHFTLPYDPYWTVFTDWVD